MFRNNIRKNRTIWLYGRHSVYSAISNSKRKINQILVSDHDKIKIEQLNGHLSLSNRNVKPQLVKKSYIDKIIGKELKHQGLIMQTNKLSVYDYKSIFDNKEYINKHQIGVILDQITDPNNLGSIYRSAFAFNISFIVNISYNSVFETSSLVNTACGAYENISTYKTSNINNSLIKFKKEGWWIVGLDHSAKYNISSQLVKDRNIEKVIVVLGSEGQGIRKLVKSNCDFLLSIPMSRADISLNVSNAASIAFFELSKTVFN